MDKKYLNLLLKGIIWFGLGVIIFSPLYVSSRLFFPFIVTKAVAFQVAVEVMLVAYLLLCCLDKNYRLRANVTVLLLLLYLVVLTVASAFSGNDFYHSFWSNNERSDGILLLTHLFLLAVVLTGFLRTVKEWLYAFDLFLAAVLSVAVVSFDQYLALAWPAIWHAHIMASSDGTRLAATIGNAGYVGGYMVFGVFVSLFMLLRWQKNTFEKNYWWLIGLYFAVIGLSSFVLESPSLLGLAIIVAAIPAAGFLLARWNGLKYYYGFLIIFSLFIAIETETRGAYLALAAGGIISQRFLLPEP